MLVSPAVVLSILISSEALVIWEPAGMDPATSNAMRARRAETLFVLPAITLAPLPLLSAPTEDS